MNKRVKWGIIIVIGAGLIGGGIYSQLPKENEELAAADKVMTGQRSGKKILNINAEIIKPQLLKKAASSRKDNYLPKLMTGRCKHNCNASSPN